MNHNKILSIAVTASSLLLCASCASIYDITSSSLSEQVSAAKPANRKVSNSQGLLFAYSDDRETNGLDTLVCTAGKKMEKVTVTVNPNMILTVRDTARKPARIDFYLDSVSCTDSTLTGSTSQILKNSRTISLKAIKSLKVNASSKGDLKYR